jgi:uncharacterized damage-inducible protein DinB
MTEIDRIVAELRRMFEGPAWHGPSVRESLHGITADVAKARPLRNVHTIYELTHHIGAWIEEVRSRLCGNAPGDPTDGDWPSGDGVVDSGSWSALLEHVWARHAALLEEVSRLEPGRLDRIVDPAAASSAARSVTYYILIHGLVQHHAYHAGQIMLLRRAMDA